VSPGRLEVGQQVVVEAPATIANLGAGFDCLGLAIGLTLRVEVRLVPRTSGGPAARLDVTGEGAGQLEAERGNRFVDALRAGLERRGTAIPEGIGVELAMTNEIPLSRGLGSSGAATVAGLLAAEALAGRRLGGPPAASGGVDSMAAMLALATELEGHPDNVAPALLGGLVASARVEGTVTPYRLTPPDILRVALFVPDRPTSTARMRAILPADVPRADAVATLGRAATAMAGIASGEWSALRLLAGDRLHEPYRAAAYPELPGLVAAAVEAGALLACLAGSGSTIAAFTLEPERAADIAAAVADAGARAGLAGRPAVVRARGEGLRLVSAPVGAAAEAGARPG
jgi:homoserine kinase